MNEWVTGLRGVMEAKARGLVEKDLQGSKEAKNLVKMLDIVLGIL